MTTLRKRSNGMMMNASSGINDVDVDNDDDQFDDDQFDEDEDYNYENDNDEEHDNVNQNENENDNEMIVAIGRSIEKVEEKDEEDNIVIITKTKRTNDDDNDRDDCDDENDHENDHENDNVNDNDTVNMNDDENESKPPAKKKMRRHLSKNNIIKKKKKKEEDCVHDANNATHTKANDNYNDKSSTNNSNNGVDDGEGYESWTEGDWCLVLLPFPAAIDDNIETGPSTTTRRCAVRNRNSSNPPFTNPVGGIDDNDADDDDKNDAASSTESKKGESTMGRYTSLLNTWWDQNFQRLVNYKKEYNSTTVPYMYTVNGLNLGTWVHNQRTSFRNKGLSVERTNRLESIGFVWNINDCVPWVEMYQRLVVYQKQHKTTNVPSMYKKDPKLGIWVHSQRKFYKKNELCEERISHLESIGFVWNPHDVKWTAMYHKLVEYKRHHHGLTTVPQRYTEDPALGRWANLQRCTYNKGNLSGKRLKLLNAINFVWSAKKNAFS